jgi:D-alanyl-D-alanine carboxypeptidase
MDQVKSMQEALDGGLPPYQFPYTSDQTLAKFASGKLVSAPGTAFDYNNGDYVILGKIIEHLYGQPYETVVKDRLLDPLHLTQTGLLHQQMIVPRLAETYFYRDDIKQLVPDFPVYPENWYAAGAMYSTVDDLRRFADALFGMKLVSRESLALMTKPGLDDYGYGLWAYETEIQGKKFRVVKRPGQIMGAQTQLYHFMDLDITIVILSNAGTTDLDEFVKEIGLRVVSNGDNSNGSVRSPTGARTN